jgi:uncharacterized SAM-binding protein YcdF (DUF218 family)
MTSKREWGPPHLLGDLLGLGRRGQPEPEGARRMTARRLATAFGDAAAWILLIDAVLSVAAAGHGSIAFVFFHLPDWVPAGPLVPTAIAAGILLRFRPAVVAAVLLAGANAGQYLALRSAGAVSGWWLSLSLLLALAFVPALWVRRRAPIPALAAAAGLLVLAHVLTFGHSDYRREADAIVVFGAKAYSDGTPSQALRDRTLTGIDLYKQGYAPVLIFSGGGIEPAVMKRLAVERGVPDSAIVLDEAGLNTEATLRFVRRWHGRETGATGRVLAVSHSFHNARIKMLSERFGLSLATVPCREPVRLSREPYYVARECAAIAAYYLTVR